MTNWDLRRKTERARLELVRNWAASYDLSNWVNVTVCYRDYTGKGGRLTQHWFGCYLRQLAERRRSGAGYQYRLVPQTVIPESGNKGNGVSEI